jgi:hypothetical protein
MAERLNKRQADSTRAKIQASQLLNRLQDHAHGKVEMTSTQIKAAEICLRKSLPDLSAVSHDIEEETLPRLIINE